MTHERTTLSREYSDNGVSAQQSAIKSVSCALAPADGAEEPCLSRTLRCQVLQAKELVVITSGLESDFRAQVENALRIIGCANSLILLSLIHI